MKYKKLVYITIITNWSVVLILALQTLPIIVLPLIKLIWEKILVLNKEEEVQVEVALVQVLTEVIIVDFISST